MKKILFILSTIISIFTVNAKEAIEIPKVLDNIYMGIEGGLFTPLDFNSVFPLDSNIGLKVGKQFSPVFGFNVEGLTWFGSNHYLDSSKFVRTLTLGPNLTMDITNFNYDENRKFHVTLENGIGWLHFFEKNTEENLYMKNSVAFSWYPNQKVELYAAPSIYWNLDNKQLDKHHAQLGVQVGVNYHFKTSNGTHNFKKYDITAMEDETEFLCSLLVQASNKEPEIITVENVVRDIVNSQYVVYFSQGSYEIYDFVDIDEIPEGCTVEIVGTASPEGDSEFNQQLSYKRAYEVAKYLSSRGVTVRSFNGVGVTGENSNRVAIITIVQ